MEEEDTKHFFDMGRPATDVQLVIGLSLLKHMTGLSDVEVVEEVLEKQVIYNKLYMYMQKVKHREQPELGAPLNYF